MRATTQGPEDFEVACVTISIDTRQQKNKFAGLECLFELPSFPSR